MTNQAVPRLDPDTVITALEQAIEEIEKRNKEDPVRQLADEIDDVLRRYIVETVSPPRPKS